MQLIISALLISLFCLTSCQTTGVPQNFVFDGKNVQNGCFVKAVNCQIQVRKDPEVLWTHILIVRYINNGTLGGHALCAVKMKNGQMYTYDYRGWFRIKCSGDNPEEVATEVMIGKITEAYYE